MQADKDEERVMSRQQTIWHDGFAHLGFPAALTQQTGWKIYVNGQPTSRGRHLAFQYRGAARLT